MNVLSSDKLAIRETVENWVAWCDAGNWERFATVRHADGWMTATWFQGPAEKFIEVSREGFNKGVSILHFLGLELRDQWETGHITNRNDH